MAQKDYYDIMGLKRGASEAEIKKAFRRLAHKYHIDGNPSDKDEKKRSLSRSDPDPHRG